MGEYTAEDYIKFIESGRFDKISNHALVLIANEYRELEESIQETWDKEEDNND